MAEFTPKPPLWGLDYGAVDPYWYDHFWSHCIACVPAWEGGATPRMIGNVFPNGTPPTSNDLSSVGSPTWSPGPALTFPAGSSEWHIPNGGSTDLIGTNRVTILRVRKRANTTLTNGSNFGAAGTAAANRAGGSCPWTDGVIYFDFGGFSGANRISWSGYTVSTNVEAWAFVAGTQGSAIYFNGSRVASQTTAITRTPDTGLVGMHTGETIGTSDAEDVLLFALLDTEWTPGIVAEWAEDPYAPFRMVELIPTAAAAPASIPFFNLPQMGI